MMDQMMTIGGQMGLLEGSQKGRMPVPAVQEYSSIMTIGIQQYNDHAKWKNGCSTCLIHRAFCWPA